MSKHWRPDEDIARARFGAGRRLRSLDESVPPDWVGRPSASLRTGMQSVERQLPHGAKAGLVLVAAACLGVAFGIYLAFSPHEPIAPGVQAQRGGDRPASSR